ncbi:hypothetical protein [Actinokineospora fastidiosa]|uniref:Uncharacterized protein n=1 Tax=Actinokineospora fastidiosa TaxID=1816 RepID=A0A918G575_9PSEU|nr:hypothetical protein [Actinokineospora fastidiosa]GGS19439.1 hypothetical protein GCM10010171_10030 [Actinokineospora fastidiosa]
MRRLLGITAAILASAATALIPASASAAPPPFLAVDCEQTVHAFRGQPVRLSRIAVSRLVTDATRAELGGLRAAAVNLAFPLGPAIPVGVVPNGSAEIPGAVIADAVAEAVAPLPEIAPAAAAVTDGVRTRVAEACGMTVHALDKTDAEPGEAPRPPAADDPATTPNAQPVGGADAAPAEVELYDPAQFARSAPRDYGGIPVAHAGVFAPSPDDRYGSVPGYSPEFGLLGREGVVDTAGEARALPVGGGQVALPVLLAVLLLSVVTGALVRTWVLRRG